MVLVSWIIAMSSKLVSLPHSFVLTAYSLLRDKMAVNIKPRCNTWPPVLHRVEAKVLSDLVPCHIFGLIPSRLYFCRLQSSHIAPALGKAISFLRTFETCFLYLTYAIPRYLLVCFSTSFITLLKYLLLAVTAV